VSFERRYRLPNRAENGRRESEKAESEKRRKKFKIQHYPSRVVGGAVAEDLFDRVLCLPSGTAMSNGDLDRIIETIKNVSRRGAKPQRKA